MPVDYDEIVLNVDQELDAGVEDNVGEEMIFQLGDEDECIEEEEAVSPSSISDGKITICPRSKNAFYNTILKTGKKDGMRLWKRPPHDACTRCDEHETKRHRLFSLQGAIHSVSSDPGNETSQEILVRAGGIDKARQEVRDIEHKLEDLGKHVYWRDNQRPYLKNGKMV